MNMYNFRRRALGPADLQLYKTNSDKLLSIEVKTVNTEVIKGPVREISHTLTGKDSVLIIVADVAIINEYGKIISSRDLYRLEFDKPVVLGQSTKGNLSTLYLKSSYGEHVTISSTSIVPIPPKVEPIPS